MSGRGSFSAGTHERRDSQIEKYDNDDGRNHESGVVGTVQPTGTGTPNETGEDERRQKEKNAGNLKPEGVTYAAEGLHETSYAAHEAMRGLSGVLARGAAA